MIIFPLFDPWFRKQFNPRDDFSAFFKSFFYGSAKKNGKNK